MEVEMDNKSRFDASKYYQKLLSDILSKTLKETSFVRKVRDWSQKYFLISIVHKFRERCRYKSATSTCISADDCGIWVQRVEVRLVSTWLLSYLWLKYFKYFLDENYLDLKLKDTESQSQDVHGDPDRKSCLTEIWEVSAHIYFIWVLVVESRVKLCC